MDGLAVSYFPPMLSADSLRMLGNVNKGIVARSSPRLANWIADRVIGECERRVSDGNTETEPGCPVIDLHLWTNAELADGLRCVFLLSTWAEPVDLGEFLDGLLEVFVIAAESCLRASND